MYVDAVGQFLKLIFHQNHVNKYNIYNQVRPTAPQVSSGWGRERRGSPFPPTVPQRAPSGVRPGESLGHSCAPSFAPAWALWSLRPRAVLFRHLPRGRSLAAAPAPEHINAALAEVPAAPRALDSATGLRLALRACLWEAQVPSLVPQCPLSALGVTSKH